MSMFEKIFKPKPQEPPSERAQENKEEPRIIWYVDEYGDSHVLEGTLETPPSGDYLNLNSPLRSFLYVDREGKRIKVKNARNWRYKPESAL